MVEVVEVVEVVDAVDAVDVVAVLLVVVVVVGAVVVEEGSMRAFLRGRSEVEWVEEWGAVVVLVEVEVEVVDVGDWSSDL